MRFRSFFWALALLTFLPAAAQAQIATYAFTGSTAAPTQEDPNANASAFTVGPGVTTTFSGTNPAFSTSGYAGTSTTPGTQADAVAGNDYVQLTVTARVGSTLNLDNVTADLRRSGTGPSSIELRTSLDGFASRVGPVQTLPTADVFETKIFPINNALFDNIPTVTLRFYGYGATATTGTLRYDNVVVNGTVFAEGGETTVVQTVEDGAGYRLLGSPVQAFTVNDLSAVNLVQGVPGQYPDAGDNLFVNYTDAGYVAASDTAAVLQIGRGFFWQLYDQRINPDDTAAGGGTSESYLVPERRLVATGGARITDLSRTFQVNSSGFYLAANPFTRTLVATGVTQTAGGGTFSNFIQLYDPSTGYVPVDRTTATNLATWQGFFAEVQGATAPVELTYLATSRVTSNAQVVSRAAPANAIALALDGTTASGTEVHDRATVVRFTDGAAAGWDAGDASKLTPLTPTTALLAPVGVLDGAAYRQAVLSLPALGTAVVRVPLAFSATEAGTYTVSSAGLAGVPETVAVTLSDVVTGKLVDLRAEGAYTFEAAAGAWTNRFVLIVTPDNAVAGETGPGAFSLGLPAPNPANGQSALALRVDAAQHVTATVVDALGRTVATVFEGALAAGAEQALVVPTGRLAPGVYVVRVAGETFAQSRRLVVAR